MAEFAEETGSLARRRDEKVAGGSEGGRGVFEKGTICNLSSSSWNCWELLPFFFFLFSDEQNPIDSTERYRR